MRVLKGGIERERGSGMIQYGWNAERRTETDAKKKQYFLLPSSNQGQPSPDVVASR